MRLETSNGSAASQISIPSATVDIVARARSLEGVDYKHLGRSRQGIDCLGVVLYALNVSEDQLPEVQDARARLADYYTSRRWSRGDIAVCSAFLVKGLTNHLHPHKISDAKAGDILTFWFKSQERQADHVGILVDRKHVIHADRRRGVIRTELNGKLEQRALNAYRTGN